jgi:hypothetical protein
MLKRTRKRMQFWKSRPQPPLSQRDPSDLDRVLHSFRISRRYRLDIRRLEGGSSNIGNFRRPFVYYPLHVDPEASTMTFAPAHTDQLAVVEALAKSIPATMDLVVKEHLPMVGQRPPGFYERLGDMPGVILASPRVSSFELVQRAALTAVITGTAAWEAMLLGRPALVIGQFPFACMGEGFVHEPCLANFPAAIDRALACPPADESRLELFVASVFKVGRRVPTSLVAADKSGADSESHEAAIVWLADELLRYVPGAMARWAVGAEPLGSSTGAA